MKEAGRPRLLPAATFYRPELVSFCESSIVRRATRSFTAAGKAGAGSANKCCQSALLFSSAEAEKVDVLLRTERQRHKAWVTRIEDGRQ